MSHTARLSVDVTNTHDASVGEGLGLLSAQQPCVRAQQGFLVRNLGKGNSWLLHMAAHDGYQPRREGLSIDREP